MTKAKSTGFIIEPKNKKQREFINSVSDFPVTFAIGSAGAGKTFLATAQAVEYIHYNLVDKLIVVRPAVATEQLGFLPGDMAEKIDPYLLPIWDALSDILGPEKFANFKETNKLEVAALAFMRGRTFKNAFIILDEAQNTTVEQMKMFLTRFGDNVKVVITGDLTQSDISGTNGLQWAIEKLELCKSVNIVKYVRRDVVRSPLVRDILQHLEKGNRDKNDNIPESAENTAGTLPDFIVNEGSVL